LVVVIVVPSVSLDVVGEPARVIVGRLVIF
jgi:hypothetical protein